MRAAAYQDELHHFIRQVLAEIGPRESCGDNERRLGQRLAERWRGLGHEVHSEPFRCHPKAFLGFIPVSALLYLAATVTYWVWPWLCVALAGLATAMILLELVRYREFLDPLFPAAEGENVIAVIRPREIARQRVVVSAHQDSAYEFTLRYLLGNAAVPIMLLGFFAVFVPLLGGLAKALSSAPDAQLFNIIGYVCLALYPFVGLNLVFPHLRAGARRDGRPGRNQRARRRRPGARRRTRRRDAGFALHRGMPARRLVRRGRPARLEPPGTTSRVARTRDVARQPLADRERRRSVREQRVQRLPRALASAGPPAGHRPRVGARARPTPSRSDPHVPREGGVRSAEGRWSYAIFEWFDGARPSPPATYVHA
ncbi:MAG: hypothetical protein ABI629_13640 [bacterium]